MSLEAILKKTYCIGKLSGLCLLHGHPENFSFWACLSSTYLKELSYCVWCGAVSEPVGILLGNSQHNCLYVMRNYSVNNSSWFGSDSAPVTQRDVISGSIDLGEVTFAEKNSSAMS